MAYPIGTRTNLRLFVARYSSNCSSSSASSTLADTMHALVVPFRVSQYCWVLKVRSSRKPGRQSLPARVWICMWAQALSRSGLWTRALAGNDMARPCIIAQLTMPRLWVGSDRIAEFAKSKQKRRPGAPYAAETALEYGHISEDRDETGEPGKWCGIPAPSSPFPHRRTLGYHPWASQGVPMLSWHVPYALDRKTHGQVMV